MAGSRECVLGGRAVPAVLGRFKRLALKSGDGARGSQGGAGPCGFRGRPTVRGTVGGSDRGVDAVGGGPAFRLAARTRPQGPVVVADGWEELGARGVEARVRSRRESGLIHLPGEPWETRGLAAWTVFADSGKDHRGEADGGGA